MIGKHHFLRLADAVMAAYRHVSRLRLKRGRERIAPRHRLRNREMVDLGLIRDSSDSAAPDVTVSYPDYEAYRDSVNSFSGLLCRPAHARNRHPHGCRRSKARHPWTHPARKYTACARWIACRNVSRCWSLSRAARSALWTQYSRRCLLRGRLTVVFGDRTASRLPTVASSHARRSHGGAQI